MLVNRRSNKMYGVKKTWVEQYQMPLSNGLGEMGLGELGLGEMGGHQACYRVHVTVVSVKFVR